MPFRPIDTAAPVLVTLSRADPRGRAVPNAAKASGAGIPAAMGPIGLGAISDLNDQFWPNAAHPFRKVGPRIPSVFYTGWWYLHL